MIKYTTKDIVKRAEQLTDFTSSEFISTQEKIYLLNESYTILYQALINSGDKSFLKTVELDEGDELPSDLYQVCTVYDQWKQLLKKKSASSVTGYDIVNNRIYGSSQSFIVDYFPNPKTLFLKDETVTDLSISVLPIAYSDNFYVTLSDSTLSIYLTSSNTILQSRSDDSSTICHFSNGIVDLTNKTFTPYGARNSYSFDVLMVKGNTVTLDKVVASNMSDDVVLYITDESEEQHYFMTADLKVYTDCELQNLATTLSTSNLIYCRQDGLYFSTQNSQYLSRLNGLIVENLPINFYGFVCFVNDTQILVSDGNTTKMTGFGFNTLLDYPNNVFYTYLAYDLAIAMCNVVQRDATTLTDKQDEIRAELYASIKQDSNEVYQIKDVNQVRSSIYGNW